MNKDYLLNDEITSKSIRISGEKECITLTEALNRAADEDADLIQIAKRGNESVCIIKDYNKFLYEQNKKDRGKAKVKVGLKEIKLGLNIGEHDMSHKAKKAIELMNEGSRVKVSLFMSGREITRTDDAFKLINAFVEKCNPCTYDKEPKLDGKVVSVVIFKK